MSLIVAQINSFLPFYESVAQSTSHLIIKNDFLLVAKINTSLPFYVGVAQSTNWVTIVTNSLLAYFLGDKSSLAQAECKAPAGEKVRGRARSQSRLSYNQCVLYNIYVDSKFLINLWYFYEPYIYELLYLIEKKAMDCWMWFSKLPGMFLGKSSPWILFFHSEKLIILI